jgi:transposase
MIQATVLTGPERRRRWTSADKMRMVEESLATGSRVIEVARRHDVHPNLLHLWRRQARTGVLSVGTPGAAGFVPIAIGKANGPGAMTSNGVVLGSLTEVVLRNGRVLRLAEGVTPARAADLADALEGLAR